MRGHFLDDCLIDPTETKRRRKPALTGALATAMVLEALVASALALYPLFTPAKLRPQFMSAPIPARYSPEPMPNSHHASSPRSRVARTVLFSPPRIPARILRAAVSRNRAEPPPSIGNSHTGLPFGVSENAGSFVVAPIPLAPPRPVRIIHRSEKFEESQLIRRVVPDYPDFARIARISGTVELLVLVGRDGLVKSVQVLSGNPLLARSATTAVAQWHYRPAILGGEAVEVETRVTVHFLLNE